MKFPSVTIHVTAKNAKNTIKQCVDSLLRLNYPNYQIVVTDAYSTDGTYEILRKYGNKIKLERIEGSAPRAHNHVLSKVRTEFYAMTDADCVVDKNWLKNIISGFTSKDIVATGGIVKTPKNANKLQSLIGRELEERYRHFPKKVSRFPTMNMAVRTSIAKKVKMNEKLKVAFETDWGFKLEKYGELVYVPEAVVWHYHRGSLISFFKQQMNYGRYILYVYQTHKVKLKGDYISTSSMLAQLILFSISGLLFLLSVFSRFFSSYFSLAFFLLLFSYIWNIKSLYKKPEDIISFSFLFFIRNLAWCVGILLAIFDIASIKS
jgi:cellulose synthase/poly-beta-1,6-N-acetylglucosamine synthase-like glycosyltransferase